VGRKWTLNYHSYLQENATDGSVLVVLPDGAQELYTPDGSGGYTQGYKVFNRLAKLAVNHFQLTMPDDTVFIYQIPSGSSATTPLIVEWRDAWGQALTLGYNAEAQLSSVTDPTNRVTTLIYTNGRITRVQDPFGRFAQLDYDADGDLSRITDMGGYWTAMAYDAQGYITEMENEKGITLFYIEPAAGGSTTNPYPPPGETMQASSRITVTDPEGNKSEYHYNGLSGYGWYVSPRHYMPYVDAANCNFSDTVPKIIYNYANTLKGFREEIATLTFQEGTRIGRTYNYDTGLPTSVSDFEGNTTFFLHNPMGRITSVTPPVGLPITYQYNPANNLDLEHVVREGLGTKNIAYNGHHQVTQVEDEEGHITGPIAYDTFGRIDTVTETFDGRSVLTDYDYFAPGAAGEYRLRQIIKDGAVIASYTYDSIGRVHSATDATGLTLTYDYNDLNHVTRITSADGKFVEYGYSSCCPRSVDYVTDRAGRTTYFTYDKMQRLVSEHQPGVGYIHYQYDANGNLTHLTDANGNTTRFEYDNEDRLYRKYDAEEHFVEYRYNSNGLLERSINSRGIETIYSYDEDHKPSSVTHSDGTPGISYGYDNYRRLSSVTDALGTQGLTYYDNGLTETIDGPWLDDTISYAYDNLNRFQTITPQGGRPRTYTYDNQGRLENITLDAAIYTYGYQGANPLMRTLTRPNNSRTNYDYSGLNQLEHLTNRNASEQVLSQFDFQYNDQDLIGHETVTVAPQISGLTAQVVSYDYNALNQLTNTTNPAALYAYDDDGNLTGGYTLDGRPFTAAYDAEERLRSIEYTDGEGIFYQYEFIYGHDGFLGQVRRYQNMTLVEDRRIVRDGTLAIQERDTANTVLREYTWGENIGGGIGGLLNMRQAGQDYHYLYDGKGNVSAVIDSAQAIVASYRYDTFGRLMTQSGTLDQPYRFSTKQYLADLGLNYFGYRFYSPAMGRWLNRDPLGETGGINLYAFVQNDPVNLIDPDGLSPAGKVIGFSKKAWNHIAKRHVARDSFPGKSKFKDPSTIKKNAEKTVKHPDKTTQQNDGRTVYEKDFGKEIGTRGETIQRVVTGKYGDVVTTFPSDAYKAVIISIFSFFDPTDAISGELSNPQEDADGNGIPDYLDRPLDCE
jgi:RHS repeat-associated protein